MIQINVTFNFTLKHMLRDFFSANVNFFLRREMKYVTSIWRYLSLSEFETKKKSLERNKCNTFAEFSKTINYVTHPVFKYAAASHFTQFLNLINNNHKYFRSSLWKNFNQNVDLKPFDYTSKSSRKFHFKNSKILKKTFQKSKKPSITDLRRSKK